MSGVAPRRLRMRLADDRSESERITRAGVARLMASGKLGERIVAAARAAAAVHLAESNWRACPAGTEAASGTETGGTTGSAA